ncbi:unnamed protein product [Cuscuta epithymum]|uniref:Uncharacterized protein n=1 Tax=Cuscuta epithymum TaxID=186058 RepID=A0AAV0DW90_9ASTE|nr:unnamed protein product [Cuscuta epithymum]
MKRHNKLQPFPLFDQLLPKAQLLVAENDFQLTRRRTRVRQRRHVVRVRVRRRASLLEELRVARRPARLRAVEMVPAAELVRLERFAPTLAGHHRPVTALGPEVKLRRARLDEIRPAADHRTVAFPFVGGDRQGEVEAVDEADRVGGEVTVSVVEIQLDESRRKGAAGAVALQPAAAVPGVA